MNTFDDLSSYFRNLDRSTERPYYLEILFL